MKYRKVVGDYGNWGRRSGERNIETLGIRALLGIENGKRDLLLFPAQWNPRFGSAKEPWLHSRPGQK
ncbi:hypothetical protein MA16_Dca027120 [Dendrobium catenatum]|uniref:Uncharacterized protein n=1 Tax=Dendrobium catenatum TaxID=906689 RepID=A0A2I0W249_9ASPA|nr:hypothetical protein MA16_Dca027120 [Dendrobium catenatum]